MYKIEQLDWKVHATSLLREIADSNPGLGHNLFQPINQLKYLLGEVAQRAIELHDPQLDYLMMRLALYSVADPESKDYDFDTVERYKELARLNREQDKHE